MAVTDTKKYTVQEKLNKMDVDVIEVDVAAEADGAGDILYVTSLRAYEIPNAVAVPGGTCLIQSVNCWMPQGDSMAHNLFISDNNSGVINDADDGADAASVSISSLNIHPDTFTGIQAVIPIPTGYAVGNSDYVSSVLSIGAVCKAAAGSTSLYFFGLATTADTIDSTIKIKFGIVKD